LTVPIDVQIRRLELKLTKFAYKEVPRAHSSALNKTAAKIQTRVIRAVSEDAGVKSKFIRNRFFIKKSKPSTMKAVLSGYGRDIPLISIVESTALSFSKKTGKRKYKGIRAGGKLYQRAFYQKVGPSKKLHILQRETEKTYPIRLPKIPLSKSVKRLMPKITQQLVHSEYRRLVVSALNYRISRLADKN